MAKGNNNIRNKKPHSSKPYDVSNSFVKKVTSGVTSLLPQGLWLTRWFASTSTAVEERQSETNNGDDRDDGNVSHSPPAKRARIPLNRPFPANSFRVSSPIDRGETHPWPSESVASPIPNVFSDSAVPGPSGLGRTPVASGHFQSPSANAEGLEGKINGDGGSDSSESTSGCSSLAPQRATSSGTIAAHRASVDSKLANHMPSFSLFPAATHKLSSSVNPSLNRRRPSFNVSSFGSPNLDSSKLSRESSLSSPFYIGRTMFGGASAYRRPREGASSEQTFLSSTRRGGVTVRPANEKSQASASAETSISQTARRILEALEQFSSPVSEARRMPLPPQPALSAKRKRPLESMSNTPEKSTVPAAVTNPLTIPMPPERLRLRRLQDATEAARRIASSVSSSTSKYSIRSNDDGHHAGTGKVTKSKPLDEDELPLPVNLPHVSLPITTLPSFDLFAPQVQSSSANSRTDTSITAKATATSDQDSDKVEGEKSKISCAVSASSPFARTTSNVNSSATTKSGMKSINFMHVKSSADVPKFKIGTANTDASYIKCSRKSEFSSESANISSNQTKFNPKSVSFSGTFSYHVNNPANSMDKIDKSNSSLSSDVSSASAVSTFMIKGAPISNARTDSDNGSTTNDYTFSTPTVLSTAKLKDSTEKNTKSFDFCKPHVLDSSKYGSKLKRNEPNGFHKLHSSSKVEHDHAASVLLNTGYKEGSGKMNVNKDGESKGQLMRVQNTGSKKKENNGWGAKFSVPDSWECPSCMVRNKNEVESCVCCGSKPPSTSTSNVLGIENKPNAVPSSVSSSGWGSKFTLQPGMWECSECFVRNKSSELNCVSCTTPKSGINKSPLPVSTPQGNWGSQFRLNAGLWECSACFVRNKEQDVKCVSCTTPRSSNATSKEDSSSKGSETKIASDWGQKFKKPSGNWECPVCMIRNKDSVLKCAACQEPKPGMDKNRSSTGGSIKFNFEMPSGASTFKFGIDKAEVKQPEVNSAMFSFGSSAKTASSEPVQAGFVFGTSATESKIPAGIKFGVQSQDASSIISSEKLDSKAGDSQVTTSGILNVPVSTAGSQVSQKHSSQPETAKSFTFGVPVSSSVKPIGESTVESKKLASTSDNNDALKKDLKFGVSQASPIMSSIDDAEKKSVTFATPLSKTEQKSVVEGKPSFNFNTTSTSAANVSNITSTTTTTTTTTAITNTATTNTATTIGTKPGAFTFSSNLSTSVSTTAGSSLTTAVTAAVTSVSSSTAPVFSFGNNSTSFKSPVTSTPTFSFGGTGVQTSSSGIFGAAPLSQFKSSGDGLFSNKLAASTNIPLFGGSTAMSPKMPSLPSFGATAGVSNVTTTVASTVSSTVSTTTTTTSNSTFGTPATPVFASLNPTTAVTFGSSVTKPTIVANANSSFGSVSTTAATVSTTVPTAVTASTPAPAFGLQTTTTTPSFGAPSTTSTFNSSVPAFGSTTTSSGFGMPTTTTSVANTTAPATNFVAAPNAPFGAPTTTAGNCFGASSVTPSFSTTASGVFGTSNTPSFGSASTTPAFGPVTTASNFGSSFVSANTTAPTFGTATPAVTTVSASPSLPVFGGFSNPAKPAQGIFMFGSNPTTTTLSSNFSFNVATQAGGTQPAPTGTSGFSFGSGAMSSATNVTTSTSTTPTAAAVAPAAAQGFGGFSFTSGATAATPSAPSLFGNASPATPVFGAPSVPSSAPSGVSFGTGSSTNAGVFRPPTFNFGSGGTQQPFAFGSGAQSGATQPVANTGFSFGQGQPSAQSQPLQFNPNVRPTFNFTQGETPQFTASAQSPTPAPPRRMKKAVRRTLRS